MGKCVLCRKDIYTNEPALLFVDEHDTYYTICAKCKKQTDILLESENVLQTKQAMDYISECMRQLRDPQVLAFLTQTMDSVNAVIRQVEEIKIIQRENNMHFSHENLKNRVAVITGAGGVLCSAFAKDLAAQGVKTAVLDIRLEAAQAVADEICAAGGQALAVACNVLEKESLEQARSQINAAFGACDILINGAGGNSPLGTTTKDNFSLQDLTEKAEGVKTFFDLDPKGIEFVFNLNFLGTLLTTQCFAQEMVGRENTCILNISSMNSYKPLTRIPAYSAAKAAVSNFTQFMAVHFAEVGLRVNAIAPGFFSTNQNKALLYNEDGSLTPRSQKILGHTPLGRFGVTQDLSGALLFLCDETYSAFITGVVLPVDGGFSAFSGV